MKKNNVVSTKEPRREDVNGAVALSHVVDSRHRGRVQRSWGEDGAAATRLREIFYKASAQYDVTSCVEIKQWTTSRRWRGIATPSRRRNGGITSMAWGVRNLISTQVGADRGARDELSRKSVGGAGVQIRPRGQDGPRRARVGITDRPS